MGLPNSIRRERTKGAGESNEMLATNALAMLGRFFRYGKLLHHSTFYDDANKTRRKGYGYPFDGR